MSYSSEHQRMKPVLDKARRLDIAPHPGQKSLYETLSAAFNLWCTPEDHPKDWEDVPMDAGAFAKPYDYVGTATWGWTAEEITHIELNTEAYALHSHPRGKEAAKLGPIATGLTTAKYLKPGAGDSVQELRMISLTEIFQH